MASAFALQRLRRKLLPGLPGAFLEVPEQEVLEEEEEIPLLDSPNRDGPNYRSSNQYPAELRAC